MRSSGLGLLPASHIKEVPMSALGQKQTSRYLQPMSALPPKADIGTQSWNVRFVPEADIAAFSGPAVENFKRHHYFAGLIDYLEK